MKIDKLLTATEEKQAVKFFNEHANCYGNLVITLVKGSGIGIGVKIKCKGCKLEGVFDVKKNITDYGAW